MCEVIQRHTLVKNLKTGRLGLVDWCDSQESESFDDINYAFVDMAVVQSAKKYWSDFYELLSRREIEVVYTSHCYLWEEFLKLMKEKILVKYNNNESMTIVYDGASGFWIDTEHPSTESVGSDGESVLTMLTEYFYRNVKDVSVTSGAYRYVIVNFVS